MFKTPPLFKPAHSSLFLNFTGISKIIVEPPLDSIPSVNFSVKESELTIVPFNVKVFSFSFV